MFQLRNKKTNFQLGLGSDVMANCVNPDQSAPSGLVWLICPNI